MAAQLVRDAFPHMDDDLFQYVEGVLESAEEFQTGDDVYDAIGGIVEQVAGDDSEDDVRRLCHRVMAELQLSSPDGHQGGAANGDRRRLDAPVHLGSMAGDQGPGEMPSIWLAQKEVASRVDTKKLEKAEEMRKKKLEKQNATPAPAAVLAEKTASASQVISKRDVRAEARGANMCKDIRIENFDISIGDKVLISGADVTLVYGRRYGFVGRNGLGKTTMLRMISSGQLVIPSHVSVLHVEQEVTGDDTEALQSVLECDTARESLLTEEKELTAKINSGHQDAGLSERLSAVYAQLQASDADRAPARAAVILRGLGFTPAMQKRPTKEFSGGWRMRLALARALFSQPDLLLLDEPTNMLDMKAIIWLEDYLQTWPSTLLVVSHDRQFLEVVPTDILFLHTQKIDCYKGNYGHFVKAKAEKMKNQQREYEAQMAFRAHAQEFIDKFRYNAKRASLVQSKIKMLEKLPELVPVVAESEVVLKFPPTEPLHPPILQLDEVDFRYPTGDKYIFRKVDLSTAMESRICIVGENGAGKTTLLKILMDELTPTSGIRHAHRNLKIAFFSQHHVDQLDMTVNSIQLLAARFPGRIVEEYRQQLGSFGVSGDLATQQVGSLSGGQKSRVAFAAICMARPNFFILDEPTNHLDIETIEALGHAINRFNGGVILVSHDERLIRMVCKELWVCSGGTVKALEGGFDEYKAIVRKEIEAANANG
ncbi:ATP-binding cassette sub-family F member 3-like [Amphibalanus amphitrite]|uniref:ATP-binding cassette sub-family F member 3-like n=1 Tax=Amphibalanus amphitrite TaxID=1232801 RepID=UPI001C8FE398|nr:ATP-binding cassette sub-family F member 3-like [Amphibalanus amphitrite]XP_043240530.1 ATP-binding cassette sub-family F member 3-like [Amphibalanus amphitrite]XP_043240531.1 ATP-binding cassette sub-family F member 3-like [Amphibalanus amphitrite]XP_043240532.1 ATP-binding cassette sub-family F member 3-like [Amphibalanus amphitrite]